MKIVYLILCIGICKGAFSQSNTFPSSGNVGIGIGSPTNLLHINSGASPSSSQLRLTANGTGGISLLAYAPDNCALNFDSDWSSSWTSRSTSAASIYKSNGKLRFLGATGLSVDGSMSLIQHMTIDLSNGNIGIGNISPGEKLSVNGKIRAKEIKVEASGWSDFVFEPDYKLPDLKETEAFIKENKHLPEIPSVAEVEKEGINLGEMNAKLLQKIEELTLYLIESKKEVKDLQERMKILEGKK